MNNRKNKYSYSPERSGRASESNKKRKKKKEGFSEAFFRCSTAARPVRVATTRRHRWLRPRPSRCYWTGSGSVPSRLPATWRPARPSRRTPVSTPLRWGPRSPLPPHPPPLLPRSRSTPEDCRCWTAPPPPCTKPFKTVTNVTRVTIMIRLG